MKPFSIVCINLHSPSPAHAYSNPSVASCLHYSAQARCTYLSFCWLTRDFRARTRNVVSFLGKRFRVVNTSLFLLNYNHSNRASPPKAISISASPASQIIFRHINAKPRVPRTMVRQEAGILKPASSNIPLHTIIF